LLTGIILSLLARLTFFNKKQKSIFIIQKSENSEKRRIDMEEDIKITIGDELNYISIYRESDVLIFDLKGAPTGDNFIKAIVTGLNSGLVRPNSCTLVDLLEYRGVVDWRAIKLISLMKEWSDPTQAPNPVAFVKKTKFFVFIMKAIGAFFPQNRFAVFDTRSEALEWIAFTNSKLPHPQKTQPRISKHYERADQDR
jgi:hypothetical protein